MYEDVFKSKVPHDRDYLIQCLDTMSRNWKNKRYSKFKRKISVLKMSYPECLIIALVPDEICKIMNKSLLPTECIKLNEKINEQIILNKVLEELYDAVKKNN